MYLIAITCTLSSIFSVIPSVAAILSRKTIFKFVLETTSDSLYIMPAKDKVRFFSTSNWNVGNDVGIDVGCVDGIIEGCDEGCDEG